MIKFNSMAIAVFLTLTGTINLNAQAQSDRDYQIEVEQNTICSFINANDVNIRQQPSTSSAVVKTLNRGDGVRALSRQGNWVQIVALDSGVTPTPFSPLDGWVYNQYINGCSEDQFDRWRS